jgi:hypothetical protein
MFYLHLSYKMKINENILVRSLYKHVLNNNPRLTGGFLRIGTYGHAWWCVWVSRDPEIVHEKQNCTNPVLACHPVVLSLALLCFKYLLKKIICYILFFHIVFINCSYLLNIMFMYFKVNNIHVHKNNVYRFIK